MICVYLPDATDFSANGLGPVAPTSCTVSESLNGDWSLQMEHPIDVSGKWTRLLEGRIVRAPVPAATTPSVSRGGGSASKSIYKVTTSSASTRLRLRAGTSTSTKVLGSYKRGTEVVVISTSNSSWYEVVCPDGKRGYMASSNLSFVRTDTVVEGKGKVIEPKQLRDQPFRIYRIVPSLGKITVYARHLFYDLADNMIKSYKPSKTDTGATVALQIGAKCLSPHDFTFYSDLVSTADEPPEFEGVNPVDAILGEDAFADKYKAELARDWYDVYLMQRVGRDTDIQIREGKNLLGISYDVDESDVVTRIMPVGQTKDGKPLYLDELYIDTSNAENASKYPHPKWTKLEVSEAKVGKDMTAVQAKAKMREAANKEFENGCDLPALTVTIDFVNAAETEEYAQYKPIRNIFLGDKVRGYAKSIGVDVALRMTEYTFDCLKKKYTKVTLGTIEDTIESSTITSRQLPQSGVTGTKIARNSVGSGQLQDGAVGSLHIQNAAIENAHIQNAAIGTANIQEAAITEALIQDATITKAKITEATIGQLNADALAAVSAKIQELAAGVITTDALYAALATISVAQITTGNLENANIGWAQIGTLAAEIANIAVANLTTANIHNANIDWASITRLNTAVANIALAQITTANIKNATIDWADITTLSTVVANIAVAQLTTATINNATIEWADITRLTTTIADIANARIENADIDWAHIKDLTAGTAIIERGVNGKLYVADLAVTEANMVSLTVGELIVKGTDGSFYAVSVDETGAVKTTKKEVSGNDVANNSLPGGKLIENTITARELNVASIFADNALIRAIRAANIDVDELFSNIATFGKITTSHLASDFGKNLDLSSNTSISLRVQKVYEDMDTLVGNRIEIISTSDILSDAIKNTTLSARVWHGSQDITDSIPFNRFNWKRVSADSTADNLWNAAHTGRKSITLTVQDVQYSATYSCELTDA